MALSIYMLQTLINQSIGIDVNHSSVAPWFIIIAILKDDGVALLLIFFCLILILVVQFGFIGLSLLATS